MVLQVQRTTILGPFFSFLMVVCITGTGSKVFGKKLEGNMSPRGKENGIFFFPVRQDSCSKMYCTGSTVPYRYQFGT